MISNEILQFLFLLHDQFVYNIVDMYFLIHSIEIVLNHNNLNKVNYPMKNHDQNIELQIMNRSLQRPILNQ